MLADNVKAHLVGGHTTAAFVNAVFVLLEEMHMKNVLCMAFVGILALMVACDSAWAQAIAQISGTAKDPSGAVLPGVEIHATQTETGITRETVTNETGAYVLPNLPIGPYRLEA